MEAEVGIFKAFYASPIQHPILLWIAAGAALVFSRTARDLPTPVRCYTTILVALSLLDAWLSSTHIYGIGSLRGSAASGVPLQAARYYKQAVEYPETAPSPDDFVRLASAWMAAHRKPEARQVIDRGVAAGESVRLLALLGDLNYSEEKYKAARQAFNRCVKLDAQYARGWLMGGYCSLELGENAEARKSLERAAKFAGQEKLARDLLKRIP